jgi:uncharacterized hydrophobic protein (TIGR00271 family)
MRLVHALVPDDRLEAVCDALSVEGVDYALVRAEGDATLVAFPLPAGGVDSVFDRLADAGFDRSEEFVVVTAAETAHTEGFGDLADRFDAEEGDDSLDGEEVRTKARNMHPGRKTYYVMTLLSVLVAVVGLLRDSPAVVVGSMVIAPQVGAALTASVGVAFGDRDAAVDGLRSLVLGLVAAVGCAAVLGWALRTAQFVPPALDVTTVSQVAARTSPGLLSAVVGLCAGAAGAFGLSTDLPVSLVGVAVAAALVPAAAAVGVGLAWGFPVVASGAAVLLVVNLLSITLAGAAALWFLGYRPAGWEPRAPVANLRAGRLDVTLVVLAVLLAGAAAAGAVVAGQATFDNGANDAVQEVLDGPRYDDLRLVEVSPSFGVVPDDDPHAVTVVVQRPADEPYPDLADRLRERVAARTGVEVAVTVEFVAVDRAPGERAAASLASPPSRLQHERDDRQHQEHHHEDPRDLHREARDAAEAREARDHGEHEQH